MQPFLIWEEDRRIAITSVAMLDAIVDELDASARAAMPITIELYHDEEQMLLIVVGQETSYVQFYSTAYHPHLWTCRGEWNDDEHIEFLYRGHHSGIDKRYTVPIAEAREALRRFFIAGVRPDNIQWEVS